MVCTWPASSASIAGRVTPPGTIMPGRSLHPPPDAIFVLRQNDTVNLGAVAGAQRQGFFHGRERTQFVNGARVIITRDRQFFAYFQRGDPVACSNNEKRHGLDSALHSATILRAQSGNIHYRAIQSRIAPQLRQQELVHHRQARILSRHDQALLFHEIAISTGCHGAGFCTWLRFTAPPGSRKRPCRTAGTCIGTATGPGSTDRYGRDVRGFCRRIAGRER